MNQLGFSNARPMPLYSRSAVAQKATALSPVSSKTHFGGTQSRSSTQRESSKLVNDLFGDSSKNLLWTVGYSFGGLLLVSIPPIAIASFSLAGVHLVAASYQFLTAEMGKKASTLTNSNEKHKGAQDI